MSRKRFHFFTTVFFAFFIFIPSIHAQFALSNFSQLDRIKNSTTFVAMNDPDDPANAPYREVIKKYWTICPVQFIAYADLENHISPESSFLTISGYETTVQNIHLYRDGNQRAGINYSNTHLYLELWLPEEKYFKGKKKEFTNKDQVQIARIELFTDFPTLSEPENIYKTNYGGEGHIRNWGPGFLKNYIQYLMGMLERGGYQSLYGKIMEEKELRALQKQSLLVPDYTLIKFNKFTGDESQKHDQDELFNKYSWPYEIVSSDQLNEKILTETQPFYYLAYVKSSTDKYVTVMNGLTGEVIYSVYDGLSYNIKSSDLKDLSKKIGGR